MLGGKIGKIGKIDLRFVKMKYSSEKKFYRKLFRNKKTQKRLDCYEMIEEAQIMCAKEA